MSDLDPILQIVEDAEKQGLDHGFSKKEIEKQKKLYVHKRRISRIRKT